MYNSIMFCSAVLTGIGFLFVSADGDQEKVNKKKQSKAELKAGDKAPSFSAKTYGGKSVKLKDYLGSKNIVLYFYPKDDTPGCTKEACSFRDNLARLNNANTAVLGVSVDNVKSHEKFKEKYELNFDLVSDDNYEIIKNYGVLRERNNRINANRVTYLIDKKGIIRFIWQKVNVDEHAKQVLEKIDELKLN